MAPRLIRARARTIVYSRARAKGILGLGPGLHVGGETKGKEYRARPKSRCILKLELQLDQGEG